MKLILSNLAEADLSHGKVYYAQQGEGLGEYFLDSLSADIDSLLLYAGIHRKVFNYHRLLASTFPYAIYYKVSGEKVMVFRILDCRQDPRKTKNALD